MKYLLTNILFSLFIISNFTGCSSVDDATIIAARKAVENGAVIIDVRTYQEYRRSHIPNAINIPVEELFKTLSRVPKNKALVLYCRTGSRSGAAAQLLYQNGYTVYDVATQSDYNREVKEPVKK
ncbi:rhodanese-like domain-containing protein [Sulfurimonas aquatica]|uniref:Rhodanese-like domain-containing protein n=1 Tax=Sulfurimonas aquatica TaxID=2672570 RepID=A0A975GBU7_9BACT|nr:rhodanese-like domain-containing protein [Sulfurimonas aquatica]QSZ41061.1 rhodanese-like domain-containing protein [Sulfurimonas aquatica]